MFYQHLSHLVSKNIDFFKTWRTHIAINKFKDLLKKVEPFSKKCEEWCLKIKTKCTEFWDKIRKSGDKK